MYCPQIIEKVGKTSKIIDIPTKLFQNRIIYLGEEINEESSNNCIHQLLVLDHLGDDDINLYIKSPGGICTDTFAIKDVIYTLKSKVNTVGIGQCSSGAAYLLACGTGKRRCTKTCRVMIHPVISGAFGSYPDVQITINETKRINDIIFNDYITFTNGKINTENRYKFDRDCYLNADEALNLNIIDEII